MISVWGESQWFRNISSAPAAQVEIGLQRYEPRQRFLSAQEMVEFEKRFRARHRIFAWAQAKLMGWPWPATEELRNLSVGGAWHSRLASRRHHWRPGAVDMSLTRLVLLCTFGGQAEW